MEQSSPHSEDAAHRKKIQNRIAQRAYRQRLKSKMETLESFRDTVTAAKLSEITATSSEVDHDTSHRSIPQIVKQLPIASFNVPVLEEASGCNESLSYFDIPTAITRHGFQTPPIDSANTCDPDGDPLPLSSWDLGEQFSHALGQSSYRSSTSRSPGSNLLSESLQQSGLNTPDVSHDGKTALHVAAENGRLFTVQILLRLQSNVLTQDWAGRTSLHLAVDSQQQDVVEELIKHPSCLDVQDKNGQTALHIAAAYGNQSIVAVLIGAGVMLEVRDVKGQTPLHVVAVNGQDKVLQLLFMRGANLDATT